MATIDRRGNALLTTGVFPPCRVATTGSNIVLSGLQTLDGIVLQAGDRVLVKDQTDQTTNGIYAASTGNWLRTADVAGNSQLFNGMAVIVAQGALAAGTLWLCTTTDIPVVIGASLLTFALQATISAATLVATSTTSQAIGTGSMTFVTQPNKGFTVGSWVSIASRAAPQTNNMTALVLSYSGTSLTAYVTVANGSGAHTDWNIAAAGPPGAQGLSGSPQLFDTRTVAAATAIPGGVNHLRTAGYAAIGDYGGALYKKAGGTTTGGFQDAASQWWQLAEVSVVRPEMFGAKGDNSTDDTTAIQNAINVAQAAPKGVVEFRPVTYKITSSLSVTAGVYLRGSGYNTTYKATSGTQIAVYGNITGLSIVTDDSWFIEKIGLYAVTPGNCTLVSVNTDNTASTNCSTCSVIRDCFFQNANTGLQATSIGLFIFDNLQFWNCTGVSMQADITTVGGGDCILTNSTFSGAPSQGHFRTGTLGGMRIVNNKFNCSGGIAAIVFAGTVVSAAAMSPLIIANNSIEGALQGISFLRTGSATVLLSNFAITGNEIGCTGNNAIGIVCTQGGGNANQWATGGLITGNLITVNNGTGLSGINLNAAADITISGNQFTANAACTAVIQGGNVARITVLAGSNGKGLNVT